MPVPPFPIVLSTPLCREDLRSLSPLVVGGWERSKYEHVAAWIAAMGDPDDPWALVLYAYEESLPSLACYHDLPGWQLYINQEPPDTAPRLYVFENVWIDTPDQPAADPDVIMRLSAEWPVIVITDPDGEVVDYTAPVHSATRDLVYGFHEFTMVGWARQPLLRPGAPTQTRKPAGRWAPAPQDMAIILASPLRREDLSALAPLVVGGPNGQKHEHLAAWIATMGDPDHPWALVVRADEASLPDLTCYQNLPGWQLYVNHEPPESTLRLYVFENVGSDSPIHTSMDPEEIMRLAATWPVIVVSDPEGMVSDYVAPVHHATQNLLGGFHYVTMVAWARRGLVRPTSLTEATQPDTDSAPYPRSIAGVPCVANVQPASAARSTTRDGQGKAHNAPARRGILGILRRLFATTAYGAAPDQPET